ncbi:hypothetical protein G6F66_014715 [Rhizopus arrhizus]|nr:hypothetical protein G6F66_014715 [Rhizopus arrhizus]
MAGFGQAHAARGPLQQHHAQGGLQRAQLLAQPGWRHAQVFGGTGQPAAFDDAAEGTHQIHAMRGCWNYGADQGGHPAGACRVAPFVQAGNRRIAPACRPLTFRVAHEALDAPPVCPVVPARVRCHRHRLGGPPAW